MNKESQLPQFLLHKATGRLYMLVHRNRMEKARRDLSKLTRTVIIDKNGHKRAVYIRNKLQGKMAGVMAREPWDSSTEKAKSLKISDFGTPEEVREMAKMPRTANNKEETFAILKEIAKSGSITSKSGLVASLSGKSIDKILSEQALHQSFNIMAHWRAVANIDKLFSNAIEPWKFELNPQKNNENLENRRYLYAPMEYRGQIHPVKFTVKEYKQKGIGKRLYSVEAINIDIWAKK